MNLVTAALTRIWDVIVRATRRRERRPLTPAEHAVGPELFVQATRRPVLYDDWPEGFDYLCGHCRKSVIARRVTDGQIWDLAFECYRCHRISLSPVLPAASALPLCVVPPPGRTDVVNGIALRRIVLAGQDAVDRRRTVAGVKGATLGYVANPPPPVEGDARLLERTIDEVRLLLGPTFDELERVDHRGRRSLTPPKHRHPLMAMVDALRSDIPSFATPTPSVHVDYLMELRALLVSLARWQRHPFWSAMLHGLYDAREYRHTFFLLAAATFFEDVGNNVEFKETGHTRTPDLLLVPVLQTHVAVEVKAPDELRAPPAPLTRTKFLEVVRSAMKKARTGKSGQLAKGHTAILVLGSFRPRPTDIEAFKEAAGDYLRDETRKGKHKHVLGIGLLAFVTTLQHEPTKTQSGSALVMAFVRNPGYDGDAKLIAEPLPHLLPPQG